MLCIFNQFFKTCPFISISSGTSHLLTAGCRLLCFSTGYPPVPWSWSAGQAFLPLCLEKPGWGLRCLSQLLAPASPREGRQAPQWVSCPQGEPPCSCQLAIPAVLGSAPPPAPHWVRCYSSFPGHCLLSRARSFYLCLTFYVSVYAAVYPGSDYPLL